MSEDIIGMDDMMAIYEVTDRFEIDRETISVPLEKEGAGSVTRNLDGIVEITVPATISTREWLPILENDLKQIGFLLMEDDDEEF